MTIYAFRFLLILVAMAICIQLFVAIEEFRILVMIALVTAIVCAVIQGVKKR